MTHRNETPEEFRARLAEAHSYAEKQMGHKPVYHGGWPVIAFFAASLPAYFALLFAGYDGDRLQLPLIIAGALVAIVTYLAIRADQSRFAKLVSERLLETEQV